MIKKIFLLSLFSSLFIVVNAQDLDAQIQVFSPKVQNTNKRSLEVLETSIRDFLNNRKWTNYVVRPQERIDCHFVINITEWDGSSNFKGEAQIRSTRPVFNSSYNSTVLALSDASFNFSYTEGETMDFSDRQSGSNLTSLLAFYAYLITGADEDTFLPKAGDEAFNKANQVVINAQSGNYSGWGATENTDNRYWLINNLLDRNFLPIRNFSAEYHTQVLDKMAETKNAVNIASRLFPELAKVDQASLGALYNQLFFTAKANEFADLIKLMSITDRLKSIDTLKDIDPVRTALYESLRK